MFSCLNSVKLTSCSLVLVLTTFLTSAQVYVYKDENGVPVFTDQPRAGASVISAKSKIQDIPAVQFSSNNPKDAEVEKVEYTVRLMRPANQETFRNNAGNLQVTVQVKPLYASGLKTRILLDGKVVTKAQAISTFQLHNIFRGEHSVQAELIDANGKIIASSESRTFYMHRATVNTAK
ncbi:DUF4124 domain-containing protein [Gayadomonas joobiniege]|uniref:DUF4124 domain-containing protein n=1 Tax=Gayadomonas joobiniege TaxID=1234606 RepID=UPI00035CDCBC|nr:DUF4124 domain-containing protein [Gayadomonas joobiniege]